ncbi:uncharacterized protein PG986_004219 [Apiospora aurea]|uniref:F-box domain-containing protein n=1 Tax=Apiospora aurea TaxID=335848 RepID=A0ABR1QMQ3_9PEZI
MASRCHLDRLPDEILQHILDLAMDRDSPFYLDNPSPKREFPVPPDHTYPALEAADGSRDARCTPRHPFSRRPDHQRDWLAANGTSRRLRRLGRASFFRAKAIALTCDDQLMRAAAAADRGDDLPLWDVFRGARSPILNWRDLPDALACVRHLVLVDTRIQRPTWFLQLPKLLAPSGAFPRLRRCTLLYEYRLEPDRYPAQAQAAGGVDTSQHDPEWITAACALARPVPAELRELLLGVGASPQVEFEEALGPGARTWADVRGRWSGTSIPSCGSRRKPGWPS